MPFCLRTLISLSETSKFLLFFVTRVSITDLYPHFLSTSSKLTSLPDLQHWAVSPCFKACFLLKLCPGRELSYLFYIEVIENTVIKCVDYSTKITTNVRTILLNDKCATLKMSPCFYLDSEWYFISNYNDRSEQHWQSWLDITVRPFI